MADRLPGEGLELRGVGGACRGRGALCASKEPPLAREVVGHDALGELKPCRCAVAGKSAKQLTPGAKGPCLSLGIVQPEARGA